MILAVEQVRPEGGIILMLMVLVVLVMNARLHQRMKAIVDWEFKYQVQRRRAQELLIDLHFEKKESTHWRQVHERNSRRYQDLLR